MRGKWAKKLPSTIPNNHMQLTFFSIKKKTSFINSKFDYSECGTYNKK